ncbi:MAG: hypothetical protein AAF436_21105 [Myxococcota bacterium]
MRKFDPILALAVLATAGMALAGAMFPSPSSAQFFGWDVAPQKFHAGTRCKWSATASPKSPRWPPMRSDTYATYDTRIWFNEPDTALIVEGEFPYSAYSAMTIYSSQEGFGVPYSSLRLSEFVGSGPNPWQDGNRVVTPLRRRRFQAVLTPVNFYKRAKKKGFDNVIALPLAKRSTGDSDADDEVVSRYIAFAFRTYLPQGTDPFTGAAFNPFSDFDRRGYVPQAEIYAVDARNLVSPKPCPELVRKNDPNSDEEAIKLFDFAIGSFEFITRSFTYENAPRVSGRVPFYRVPSSQVALPGAGGAKADGSTPVDTSSSCTGYLAATVYRPKEFVVIGFYDQPTFFDNSNVNRRTRYETGDVHYFSLVSYGSDPTTIEERNSTPMVETRTNAPRFGRQFKTTYVGVPFDIVNAADQIEFDRIKRWAEERNYNVFPLSTVADPTQTFPQLWYRNKEVASGFDGSIRGAPCWPEINADTGERQRWDSAPESFMASFDNMGRYAPVGVACGETPSGEFDTDFLEACVEKALDIR